MCSNLISVVYMCRIISCLKKFTLFYHIPHKGGMHMSMEIYLKNNTRQKLRHAYNKDKTRSTILKR